MGYVLDTSNKILRILIKAPMLAYTRDLLLKCHKYCELIKISQADNEWQETIMYRRKISSYETVPVYSAMHRQETIILHRKMMQFSHYSADYLLDDINLSRKAIHSLSLPIIHELNMFLHK